MPQSFCAYSSSPDPVQIVAGSGGQVRVLVIAGMSPTWQDGTAGPVVAAGTVATSAYGGTQVDNVAAVYYLLLLKGNAVPVLLKEQDIPTADTVLSGAPTWAKWQRIENGVSYPTPQP